MAGYVTHMYVGLRTVNEKLTSRERLQYVMGNMFPDLEFLAMKAVGLDVPHKTNKFSKFILKKGGEDFKPFVKGLKAHLVVDSVLHGKVINSYIDKLKEFDLGRNIAHVVVELALDVLITEKYPVVKRYFKIKKKRFEDLGLIKAMELLGEFFKKDKSSTKKLKNDSYKLIKLGLIDSWVKAAKLWFILKKYFGLKKSKKNQKVTIKKLSRVFKASKKLLEPDVDKLLNSFIVKVESEVKWN